MILLQDQSAFLGKRGEDAVGDRRLARPGPSANADYQPPPGHHLSA